MVSRAAVSSKRSLSISRMIRPRKTTCRAFLVFHGHQRLSSSASSLGEDTVFKDNQQRSHEHRQEIIQNEYPDLSKVSHPNLSSSADPADSIPDTEHFYIDKSRPKYEEYVLPHQIWTNQELEDVHFTHKPPTELADRVAYFSVLCMRMVWDISTGYFTGRTLRLTRFSARQWLLRIVFLETVAGVPGMMFGMVRHLNSLRRMERDRGWIKALLAEAENERVHLLTAMYLYKPGSILRYLVVIAQGLMCNALFLGYLISPRYCHSLVGYLEEQAVHTYTNLLQDIDAGKYPEFQEQASNLAIAYWKLSADATWRDVFANIRADEAHHRDVNHELADIVRDPQALNPFRNEYTMRRMYEKVEAKHQEAQKASNASSGESTL